MLAHQDTQAPVDLRDGSGLLSRIVEEFRACDTAWSMWTARTAHHGLRPLRPADAANWFNALERSREHLARWEDWCHEVASAEQAHEILNRLHQLEIEGVHFPFCIQDLDTRQIVGGVSISLVQFDHRCANLGYWMAEQQQRQGLCTWAARAVAGQAFALGFTRLEVVVRTDNHASARVARKIGAQHEGVARSRLCYQQRFFDAHVFSLLRSDLASAA